MNDDGVEMGLADLDPCPRCGGMTVLVYSGSARRQWPSVWCTECETLWEPSTHADEIVAGWWNHGQKA